MWGDSVNLYICDGAQAPPLWGGGATVTLPPLIGTDPVSATTVSFRSYPRSIRGEGKGNIYLLTTTQLFLYYIPNKTVQLLAYTELGTQSTGSNGNAVSFRDLKPVSQMGQVSGDVSRNCLYVTELTTGFDQPAIVRKLDLKTSSATIFAGQYGQLSKFQYTDGVAAPSIKFSGYELSAIWTADDGTVYVDDGGTASISVINPITNTISWFAGTWNTGDRIVVLTRITPMHSISVVLPK
jgi:DNA-binding beta-propeller fold protein YncE